MTTEATIPPPSSRPYQPRGGAMQLFYCRDSEILMEGPAGTGKTRAVLEKLNLCLMKYPGCRVLIARKTRSSMTQSVLVTFEEKVLPERSPIASGASRGQRQSYHYPNGSELVVGGLDNPDRIMSTEYDMIAVFEATEATEDDWEKLTSRLRNGVMPYQQGIADCNPASPTHWLNQRAQAERMTRILSRHEDNPTVTPAYLKRLDALSGARKERLRFGRWAQQEGIVYEEYDPNIHLLDAFDIPADWRRIRVVDFGFKNPCSISWYAIDHDGRMYRYRQIYWTGRLVEDHTRHVLRLSEGETIEATIADHDAEDRATMERHGITTEAAYKSVSEGIQAVKARLRVQPDGKPRLYFLKNSLVERDPHLVEARKPTCTEEEIEGYVWARSADGRPDKEVPEKKDDHGMDELRYAVAYVDNLANETAADIDWIDV